MKLRPGTPLTVLAAAGLAFVLASCGGAPESESPGPSTAKASGEPFRIGVVTWVGSGPFYLAQQQDLFEGLEVEISIIDDAVGRRAALTKGSIDAMLATVDDFANAAAAGLPAVAVLKTDDSYGGDGIIASGDVTSVGELAGRTVAFPQGMPSHFLLLHTLSENGMSSADIEPKYMEAGEAGAAFVAGQVDVAVTWEPWLSKASEREGGHILMTTREAPGLISDIVVVNRNSLASRPGDVEKFLRGWFAALDSWRESPDTANALMADSLNLPVEDFEGMLAGIQYADYPANLDYFGVGGDAESRFATVFQAAGEVWVGEGLINEVTNASGHVDASLLQDLY